MYLYLRSNSHLVWRSGWLYIYTILIMSIYTHYICRAFVESRCPCAICTLPCSPKKCLPRGTDPCYVGVRPSICSVCGVRVGHGAGLACVCIRGCWCARVHRRCMCRAGPRARQPLWRRRIRHFRRHTVTRSASTRKCGISKRKALATAI